MLGKILFGVAVGPSFRPENAMVSLAEGTQQAGQPDNGEIQPAETLAVGGMPELVHTNLVAKDIFFSFAKHP